MSFQETLLHLRLITTKERLIVDFLKKRLQLNSDSWQTLLDFVSLEYCQGRIRLELSKERFAELIDEVRQELASQENRMEKSIHDDCLRAIHHLNWETCLDDPFLNELRENCAQIHFDNDLHSTLRSTHPLVFLRGNSRNYLYLQKSFHSELNILSGLSRLLTEPAGIAMTEQVSKERDSHELPRGDSIGIPDIFAMKEEPPTKVDVETRAIQEVFGSPHILGKCEETQVEYLFHERQVMAAYFASLSNFFIISGGPGTGKTSVLVQVLRTLLRTQVDLEVDQIALAAPTGRAKARMAESMKGALHKLTDFTADPKIAKDMTLNHTTDNAYTLHSLLYKQLQGSPEKLNYKLIVVDEFSMVDVSLFSLLIQSMKPDCRLILLGDMHQLPPVGQGSVLGNMSQSFTQTKASLSEDYLLRFRDLFSEVPMDHDQHGYELVSHRPHRLLNKMVVLTKTHRSEGDILKLAQGVNDSDIASVRSLLKQTEWRALPLHWPGRETSMVYVPPQISSARDVAHFYLKHHLSSTWKSTLGLIQDEYWNTGLEMNRITPSKESKLYEQLCVAFEPHVSMRILCLSHHGMSGTQEMNQLARGVLQPNLKSTDRRIHGELVMLTRNQNDLELYNGDSGMVFVFRHQSYVIFPCEGFYRVEPIERLHSLQSAFAISVHKSQGSEYTSILLVLPEYKSQLLTREILYTGLTRAKKLAFLQGEKVLLEEGVRRFVYRPSGLSDWLENISK